MTDWYVRPAEGLIAAGLKYPGAHVCESERHPVLMDAALKHAHYQADHKRQGVPIPRHQLWEQRRQTILQRIEDVSSAEEICAESWDYQVDEPMFKLGWEMFFCWERSSGHWRIASKKFKYFGAGMALGDNDIWYATIVVAF